MRIDLSCIYTTVAYPRRLGQKYTLSWHDEQVVVFDCMERLQGYHYIAVLDLDEFLIPKYKEYYNWKVMLVSWCVRLYGASSRLPLRRRPRP